MKKTFLIIILLILLFVGATYLSISGSAQGKATCKILNGNSLGTIDFRDFDSVLVAATTFYEADGLKKIMQGNNYRKAWATPIQIPIAYLDTLEGGLRIIEEGGGKQTQSLELESHDGIRYTLRSINKNPEPLVPDFAKRLGLENIVIDGISAQHPYAAEVVAGLAQSAKILHTHPKSYFIPKQSALGKYNKAYGNRLYLFEYESEGKVNWTGRPDILEFVDTEDLQRFKIKHRDRVKIDSLTLVRARLFDLIIGDWDRHAKQWGWALKVNGDGYLAEPLPTDRDNAFFNIGGIIPAIISDKHITPELQSFGDDITYLPGLVTDFDTYFLKNTTQAMFLEQAALVQNYLTDSVIAEALALWPEALFRLDALEISEALRARRDRLKEYAIGFHQELQRRSYLTQPLKGSEDSQLHRVLKCFECMEEDGLLEQIPDEVTGMSEK